MAEFKDAVRSVTTTTGTGTITLDNSPINGYQPVTAHSENATVQYRIESVDRSEWENGENVLNADRTQLTRTSGGVKASSNGGALVNFSGGTKIVETTVISTIFNNIAKKTNFISAPSFSELVNLASAASYRAIQSCPVPFSAVRIGLIHVGGTADAAAQKVVIASSDNVGTRDWAVYDTSAPNAATVGNTPKKLGTTYNISAAGADTGFHPVTWAGSADSPVITDPGANKHSIIWSDLMPIECLYDATNGFYPLLIGYFRTANGSGYYSSTGDKVGTNVKEDIPGFSNFAQIGNSTNYVTILPAGWADNVRYAGSCAYPPVLVEFITSQNAMVDILIAGDSRLAVSSEFSATKAYLSTSTYLRKFLYQAGISHVLVDSSRSGWTSARYYEHAMTVLTTQKPDFLIYQIASVNDGVISSAVTEAQVRLAESIAVKAKTAGSKIIFLTDFPRNSVLSSSQLSNEALIKKFATDRGDYVLDTFNLYGNGDGTWKTGYNYDANHLKDVWYQDLASRISAIIKAD